MEQLTELFHLPDYSEFEDGSEEWLEDKILYEHVWSNLDYWPNIHGNIDCPDCDGDGEIDNPLVDDDLTVCPRCMGKGEITIHEIEFEEDDLYYAMRDKIYGEVYDKWCNCVLSSIEDILEAHSLEAVRSDMKIKGSLPARAYLLKPVHGTTWTTVATALMETINGYGMFFFNGVKEFLYSTSGDNYCEVVENHLHWMVEHSAVYGTKTPKTRYYNCLEDSFRYY
jgi:hypothetical protein